MRLERLRFLDLCDDHPHNFPSPEKKERTHQDCNMQIVYPTTPANYVGGTVNVAKLTINAPLWFHVLPSRRQIHRDFRKPVRPPYSSSIPSLIGFTFFSKSLLIQKQSLPSPSLRDD